MRQALILQLVALVVVVVVLVLITSIRMVIMVLAAVVTQALQHHPKTVVMVTTTNKQVLTYQPYSLQQEHAQVARQVLVPSQEEAVEEVVAVLAGNVAQTHFNLAVEGAVGRSNRSTWRKRAASCFFRRACAARAWL